MRQCARGLHRICHIAALFQKNSDNETCQSHSAFYEKSLECSDQSRYTCIFLIFRIIDHIRLHCKCNSEYSIDSKSGDHKADQKACCRVLAYKDQKISDHIQPHTYEH